MGVFDEPPPMNSRLAARSAFLLLLVLGLGACDRKEEAAEPVSPAPVATPAIRAPVVPTPDDRYSPAITAEDFAARVRKLASDQFEGRKPGTLGERMTTAWLKDQFERIGLAPANDGSWFQNVPMLETTLLDADDTKLEVTGEAGTTTFAYRDDMIVGTLDASPQVDLRDSDIVFVGYGVNAPEQHWNDYAGVDVKGKTVIVLVNDPGWGNQDAHLFKGRALTYYGRWTYKYEEAARQGAAACFIVHETPGAGYPWEVVVNSWSGTQYALPPGADPAPRLAAAGWLTSDAATRLFAGAGLDFAALKRSADLPGFKATELPARASLAFDSRIASSSSDNVLGYVKGSTRPEEVVIYSAHWDHFGKDPELEGDSIYNGAYDNATGVAALLEIAEAFARQEPPLQRSLLFLATTLEESGLLGSRYYVTHPAFPLDETVAAINMDALPVIGPSRDIAVISAGQSDLDEYIAAAAKAQGRSIVPDDAPEKGFFFRSDQLNFAKLGVPVLYARSGLDLVEGGEAAGRKAYEDITARIYHKVTDEYDPDWDLRGTIEDVQAFHAVGRKLADESRMPQWNATADFQRPATTE